MEIKDVEKLAELAKIELTEEEKKALLKDMDSILDYVKQITEADVPELEVNYPNKNVWREDLPASGGGDSMLDFSTDLIVEQFPDSKDGFVKVKKIL